MNDKLSILPRLPVLVFIAWRNLWRNPVRSILTISALGGGLALLIVYASLIEGMIRQMVGFATNLSTGHLQIHRRAFIDDQDLYATLPDTLAAELERRVPGARFAPRLYAAGLAGAGDLSTGVMIKAVDPVKEARVTTMLTHLRAGSAALDAVRTASADSPTVPVFNVVVGAQLARNMDLQLGDELVVLSQAADGSIANGLFDVAGILKPIEPNFDRMGILMSIDAYRSLMYLEHGVHELAVAIDDINALDAYQRKIEDAVAAIAPDDDRAAGGAIVVRTWRQLVPAVSDMLAINNVVIYFVGAFLAGLASLGMLNTMLMAVYERAYEFGILLSIGMGRYWLLAMVLMESLFLSLVAAGAGGAAGVAMSYYLQVYGIDLSGVMPDGFDYGGIVFEPVWKGYLLPQSVLIGIGLMVSIAMLASVIPSWRTVRMKPAQVLR